MKSILLCLILVLIRSGQEIIHLKPYKVEPDPDYSEEAVKELEDFWRVVNEVKRRLETGEEDISEEDLNKYYAVYDSPVGVPETIYGIEDPNADWGMLYQVTASTTLISSRYYYGVENLDDLDLSTAWVEGDAGHGVGATLEYAIEEDYGLQGVTDLLIYNGYAKSAAIWEANSRVKELVMQLNGQNLYILELDDAMGAQWFRINWDLEQFNPPHAITFTIKSVYPGSKYQDTAISELIFVGSP